MAALFPFTPDEAQIVLRALKTVAMADGTFATREQALLAAAAELLGVDASPEAVSTIAPEDLAEALVDPERRLIALKACLVMGIVDGQISPEEWRVLSSFRSAFAVDEAAMQVFHGLVQQHRQRTQYELQRRLGSPQAGTLYADQGWQGVLNFFTEDLLSLPKTRENSELAWRYRKIGLLPEGTLGRELWRYYRERQFAFAGEPGGVPEALVHHDITHILAGYDTDLEGELQTLAFVAGLRGEDPTSALFLVLLQNAVGGKARPAGDAPAPSALGFSPEKILSARARGQATREDFTRRRDFWDVMDRPIAELHGRFGIPPL
jgi:tellurite resistance protein